MPVNGATYYAHWTPVSYTISYTLNSGTVSGNPTSYTIESSAITLNNPTRTGYTFKGWSGTGLTGSANTNVVIAKGSTGNRSYTANWTLDTYTITYNLDGGTNNSSNPATYTYTTAAFTLQHPTKTGYTFKGWSGTGLTGTENTLVTIAKGSTGNRIYTANWTINQYTATFNGNGGTNGTSITKDYNAELGTLPTSTRDHYTFVGWFTAASGGTQISSTTRMPVNGATYYAHWTPVSYTISYTLNSGTVSGNPTSYTIESSAITLKNPTRTGYTFTGWSGTGLTGSANTSVVIATGSTGNRSYTANWSATKYTISYTLNSGTVSGNPTEYYITSSAITLNNPTRTGYTFAGWTGTGLSSASTSVTIVAGSTGNRSYTATWTANEISLASKNFAGKYKTEFSGTFDPATNGTGAYVYSIVSVVLNGTTLTGSSGVYNGLAFTSGTTITGTPTVAGTYVFTMRAVDRNTGKSAEAVMRILISKYSLTSTELTAHKVAYTGSTSFNRTISVNGENVTVTYTTNSAACGTYTKGSSSTASQYSISCSNTNYSISGAAALTICPVSAKIGTGAETLYQTFAEAVTAVNSSATASTDVVITLYTGLNVNSLVTFSKAAKSITVKSNNTTHKLLQMTGSGSIKVNSGVSVKMQYVVFSGTITTNALDVAGTVNLNNIRVQALNCLNFLYVTGSVTTSGTNTVDCINIGADGETAEDAMAGYIINVQGGSFTGSLSRVNNIGGTIKVHSNYNTALFNINEGTMNLTWNDSIGGVTIEDAATLEAVVYNTNGNLTLSGTIKLGNIRAIYTVGGSATNTVDATITP